MSIELAEDKIIRVPIDQLMKESYIDYSMSVIVGRALPDVRDGFKPVHRRILYSMKELGVEYNKPHKKSARIVGQCMGMYHPHGDSSIYFTLVRMAQPWSLNHELVDGQGNFGSPDGDPAAAMRYTEARLSKISSALFKEIDQDTIDWIPNFDDSTTEPSVLPVQFPQLVVNGTTGIAVGMGTNILPHNLREVIAVCNAIINDPHITDEELMEIMPAPDFPTGGIIYGLSSTRPGMLTGQKGRVTLRGEYSIEVINKKESLVFTSVPYNVTTDDIVMSISEAVNNEKITGISDVRNESSKNGIRIVIELKKGSTPNVVANHIFKHSPLQQHYPINNTVLVDGRPKVLSTFGMIREWIKFRYTVTKKRIKFDLSKLHERLEILSGYKKVLSDIDRAVKCIKKSRSTSEARESLKLEFDINDNQAKHVLELRLSKLTSLEIESINNECIEVTNKINELTAVYESDDLIYEDIKSVLSSISQEFGVDRRSKIEMSDLEFDIEEFIEKRDVIITCSFDGYVKRTDINSYRTQSRGGKGLLVAKTKDEDHIKSVFYCNTHTFLFAFTNLGRCYYMKAYKIPEDIRASKGRHISNFLQIPSDEKIVCFSTADKFEDLFVFLCTKNAVGKRMPLSALINAKNKGVNAINFEDGDELIGVCIHSGQDTILVADDAGQVIRFHSSSLRTMGRNSMGNLVMNTDKKIVSVTSASDDDKFVITISENGLGKKTKINQYRITDRNRSGVITMKCTERTGLLTGILLASDADDVMVTCKSGKTIRIPVTDIREISRDTQGVKLMDKDDDTISDFVVIPG